MLNRRILQPWQRTKNAFRRKSSETATDPEADPASLGSKDYFISTYACPGPTAISPTFEAKFARMEFVGSSKFNLSFMRHTGKWVVLFRCLSLAECLDAIENDFWFQPS